MRKVPVFLTRIGEALIYLTTGASKAALNRIIHLLMQVHLYREELDGTENLFNIRYQFEAPVYPVRRRLHEQHRLDQRAKTGQSSVRLFHFLSTI